MAVRTVSQLKHKSKMNLEVLEVHKEPSISSRQSAPFLYLFAVHQRVIRVASAADPLHLRGPDLSASLLDAFMDAQKSGCSKRFQTRCRSVASLLDIQHP